MEERPTFLTRAAYVPSAMRWRCDSFRMPVTVRMNSGSLNWRKRLRFAEHPFGDAPGRADDNSLDLPHYWHEGVFARPCATMTSARARSHAMAARWISSNRRTRSRTSMGYLSSPQASPAARTFTAVGVIWDTSLTRARMCTLQPGRQAPWQQVVHLGVHQNPHRTHTPMVPDDAVEIPVWSD